LIEQKLHLWEWIVQNLDDAIDQAKNGHSTLCKFICCCPHEDNSNISLSDKDQELLDKSQLTNLLEKEKSIFPTSPRNPSRSFTNYKKFAAEIPSVDIDRFQY
jgi:hypothetical protein